MLHVLHGSVQRTESPEQVTPSTLTPLYRQPEFHGVLPELNIDTYSHQVRQFLHRYDSHCTTDFPY